MIQEIHSSNNQVSVTLAGSILVTDAAELREKLLKYADKEGVQFHIDMQRVEFIDSSGLGVLVTVLKRSRQKGGDVIIKGIHGVVKEVFELTRLNRVFQIQS
ncbi:anti-sigma factor antagonist [Heliomicrobium modesticaldum Ice1]|uniref:Anti-sigma factor antagonist n=1 Tax=Heliobacterium modesticaldum (strain ATCC 51547 / Ice1) TaxID=498761 RepID=B0TBC8_HELMI|nr:STAS domain-containing protein [Heliomicrobium modesticaldum]ABZ85141.1 anti-sigma factor antagonist [Heliomicrobium modesticaldum Ice1]